MGVISVLNCSITRITLSRSRAKIYFKCFCYHRALLQFRTKKRLHVTAEILVPLTEIAT
jgi:hypothetical protein